MDDEPRRKQRSVRLLRITIYSEIAVIAATVAFSAGEFGMIPLGTIVPELLSLIVLVGLATWFVVPFILVSLSGGEGLATWQRSAAVALALALFCTHAYALATVLIVCAR